MLGGKYIKLPKTLQDFAELFEEVFPEHDFQWREYPNRIQGLCPFHEEKNPSFNIFEVDGKFYYKCFACGEKGTPFTLLRKFGLLDGEVSENSSFEKTRIDYEQFKKNRELLDDFIELCHRQFLENLTSDAVLRLKEKVRPKYLCIDGEREEEHFKSVAGYFRLGLITKSGLEEFSSLSDEHREFFRQMEKKVRLEEKEGWIVFPYYSHSLFPVAVKLRNIFETSRSSRVFKIAREKGVFGWRGVLENYLKRSMSEYAVRVVGVVEGETDALSLVYAGFPAFAVGSASNYEVLFTKFPLSTYRFVSLIFPDFDEMTLESRGAGVDAVVELYRKRRKIYHKTKVFEPIYVLVDRFAYGGKKDVNEGLKQSSISDILSCQSEELRIAVKTFEKEWASYKEKVYRERVEESLKKSGYSALVKPTREAFGLSADSSLTTCSLLDLYKRSPEEYPPPILGRFPVRCVSVMASFGGVGKTTFALITALRVARDEGLKVLFWTTEHEEVSLITTIHRIMMLKEFWDGREEEREFMEKVLSNVDVRTAMPEVFFESPFHPPNPKAKELYEQMFSEYDFVILDPLLSFAGRIEERDNVRWREYFNFLHDILRNENGRKACLMLHHFGKEALRTVRLKEKASSSSEEDSIQHNEDGTITVSETVLNQLAAAVRGASSIIDSARYVECLVKTERARYCVTVKTNEMTRPRGVGEEIPVLPPYFGNVKDRLMTFSLLNDEGEEEIDDGIEI